VIQNRPDIIQAEEELLEATALTKSAIASQFPKSTLSVMLGAQSSNFLPSQVIWEIGSAVTAPLINFDRIKSEINVKEAKEEQAFLNYQKVVSKALEEVEVNFGRYISYHNHHLELEKLVQNNKKALSLSKHLYESSTIPYIDVLEAEKDVYNAEILKTESLAEFSKTSVALHKALGYCI